ncbi:hypothetical protein BDD12DRAFT_805301 [Trichophaea hybrida]|nr:hypothetical protein BDD12DRAFT_805301 [Trichophaea hybrida]
MLLAGMLLAGIVAVADQMRFLCVILSGRTGVGTVFILLQRNKIGDSRSTLKVSTRLLELLGNPQSKMVQLIPMIPEELMPMILVYFMAELRPMVLVGSGSRRWLIERLADLGASPDWDASPDLGATDLNASTRHVNAVGRRR